MRQVIVAQKSVGWLGTDRVVHIAVFPVERLTLADAKEIYASYVELSADKRHPLLLDLRRARTAEVKARHYLAASQNGHTPVAIALVVSPVSAVFADFFLRLNRLHAPLRTFTNETEAGVWLRQFVS